MTTIRFVHTADWQLGMTRHFLSTEAQARFTAARLDAVRAIGALAQRERCAFVVVCGDVFETNHVERQVVVRALDAMAAHPDVTFYLLPGNHDPLDPSSVFRSPTFAQHQPANVVVLDASDPIGLAGGAQIVAAPWPTRVPVVDLAAAALRDLPGDGAPRLLVAHGGIDTMSPDDLDPKLLSLAGLEAALDDGRISFVALGDRHSTTSVGTSGRIWYAGAPEPTRFDEVDAGNALVVSLDGTDLTVEPHRIGTWRFLEHAVDLNGTDDVDALDGWLHSIEGKPRTIVKLVPKGTLSLANAARFENVLAHHRDVLASLELSEGRGDLVTLPDDLDDETLGLSGFAADAVADLRERAESGNVDAATAQDALALLYRLAGSAS